MSPTYKSTVSTTCRVKWNLNQKKSYNFCLSLASSKKTNEFSALHDEKSKSVLLILKDAVMKMRTLT